MTESRIDAYLRYRRALSDHVGALAAHNVARTIQDDRGASWQSSLTYEWAVKRTFVALWPYLGGLATGKSKASAAE